jgi:2-polyprenyl-6-methoxyphenol hydroxylase-like FAD-dependent oxidoreductase
LKAAVVGCGVGGMAAALALARKGWDVTLLEEFAEARPLGSGLILQPAGMKALDALGLGDAVREAGARLEKLEGRDTQGRLVLRLEYKHWRKGAWGLGIHRAALFEVLHGALAGSGVTLLTGARITGIEDTAKPVLRAADGRAFGPFALAVIADGAASDLRRVLRPKASAPVYPWGAVWANARDPERRFWGQVTQVYHRAQVMIGVLPMGRGPAGQDDLVSLFWSVRVADMDAFYAGDFDDWRRLVCSYWPGMAPLTDQLTGFSDLSRATYRHVSPGRWNEGACILIGDAAHAASPQLGQGGNFALIDAVELAERVTPEVPDIPQALSDYQSDRRRHTDLYQLASWAVTPLFQSGGSAFSGFRDWIYAPLSLMPGLRNVTALALSGSARLGPWPKVTRP